MYTYISWCIPSLQFSSLDSGVLPLLEGSFSGYRGRDSSSNDHAVDVGSSIGHFSLPEASDVTHWPLSKNTKDISIYLRKPDNNKIDVSDFDNVKETKFVDRTSPTSSHTFSIALQLATFIVSGTIAALTAWIITAKPRNQVTYLHVN